MQLKTFKKENFLNFFFKNYFFTFFSFANCFLPLMLVFVVSYAKNNSVYYVIDVALISGFMITFYQIGLAFAFAFFTAFLKLKPQRFNQIKREEVLGLQYFAAFFIGIMLVLVFYLLTSLYLKFAINYNNTGAMIGFGENFAFVISPSILFVLLNSVTIFNIFYKVGNLKTCLIILGQIIIFCLLTALIGLLVPNLQLMGFGIGLLIASLINFLISILISYFLKLKIMKKIKRNLMKAFLLILRTTTISIFFEIYSSVLRVIIIIAISLISKSFDTSTYYAFLLSKSIYYLSLYIFSFISIGFQYTLEYLKIKDENLLYASYKTNWLLPLYLSLITFLLVLTFYFCIPSLTSHFLMNNDLNINDVRSAINLDGPNGVLQFILLPNNWTIVMTLATVLLSTIIATLSINKTNITVINTKKETFIKYFVKFAFPVLVVGFIVCFGYFLFEKVSFKYMESFALGYFIAYTIIMFFNFLGWIKTNKSYSNKYILTNKINNLLKKI